MAFEEHLCSVCQRSAVGYGYQPSNLAEIAWACDDPECLRLVRSSYTACQQAHSRWEDLAAQSAGRAAARWLEQAAGTTELANISMEQFCEYNRQFAAAYRAALKLAVREEAPF